MIKRFPNLTVTCGYDDSNCPLLKVGEFTDNGMQIVNVVRGIDAIELRDMLLGYSKDLGCENEYK